MFSAFKMFFATFLLATLCVLNAAAQLGSSTPGTAGDQSPQAMPAMQQPQTSADQKSAQPMPGMSMPMDLKPTTLIEEITRHTTSGTSAEPNSTPVPMLMTMKGSWMLMLHGVAFLNAQQQSGPRGAGKVFSTNWIMPMAQRKLGPGNFTARTMVSLEPATITGRYYPELFQQGETAYGKPIVDGQHPHDFFMEVAALYDLNLGERSLLSFYAAPVGDPAMGPTAYPHRASASEDPIAPLGHHLEDSTHIADDVVTVGLTHSILRLEGSGFYGREPDEYRWNIDSGAIDSWSTRLTVQPGQNWSAQYSFAHLTSPEALSPEDDIQRMTASIMYNRPIARGNWASTLIWGRNRVIQTGLVWNGYLLESTLRFAENNYLWTRIENVDRTNELLLKDQFEPPDFHESIIGRVQAYTAGYDRDFNLIPHLETALGAQVTLYQDSGQLAQIYGNHPVGVVILVRVRPFGKAR
ncbi:MAG TPA: hypothetical protein VGG15_01535 [Terriglobales bacterium]